MMMKYGYLSGFATMFLTMTGLPLDEFDDLVDEVQSRDQAAELKRLSRPGRQRDIGGGDQTE